MFNEERSNIKKFKTLNYEGSVGWIAPSIETDLQSGHVPYFEDKEGKYYHFIKGVENTWDNTLQSGNLDSKEFSTQGIASLVSITGDAATEFTLTVRENTD